LTDFLITVYQNPENDWHRHPNLTLWKLLFFKKKKNFFFFSESKLVQAFFNPEFVFYGALFYLYPVLNYENIQREEISGQAKKNKTKKKNCDHIDVYFAE